MDKLCLEPIGFSSLIGPHMEVELQVPLVNRWLHLLLKLINQTLKEEEWINTAAVVDLELRVKEIIKSM